MLAELFGGLRFPCVQWTKGAEIVRSMLFDECRGCIVDVGGLLVCVARFGLVPNFSHAWVRGSYLCRSHLHLTLRLH